MDQLEYPARITKTRTRPADGLTEYLVHFDGTAASSQQSHWLGAAARGEESNGRPEVEVLLLNPAGELLDEAARAPHGP